jgi:hypothetical protein
VNFMLVLQKEPFHVLLPKFLSTTSYKTLRLRNWFFSRHVVVVVDILPLTSDITRLETRIFGSKQLYYVVSINRSVSCHLLT